ncbi:hypothetical protein AC480_01900 [miscellaneous Crenarchaeota group archaeon SMTZ1-55]|nr:MAG: hypothetical protein AC480_01900 [miscellaneous Crenarchaeota group archaeon SMTZ1-55]
MRERLGSAVITLRSPVVAGSFTSFDLIYTAGYFGIDDSGSIKIVQRFPSDMGTPQFTDPSAEDYVSVDVVGEAQAQYHYDVQNNIRPWSKTLYIKVVKGYLKAGDRIVVHYGDRQYGSPGIRMQTFCEDVFAFRVLVDAFATYEYVEVPCTPSLTIVPGDPVRWRAVVPTLRRRHEGFRLSLKAEDVWGNPSDRVDTTVLLHSSHPIRGLPHRIAFKPGQFTAVIDDLRVEEEADVIVSVLDESGRLLTTSNPLRIVEASELVPYWADMHGQSEETVGTNSALRYFQFGRDKAFLDAACHQGNDFQITTEFWSRLQTLTQQLTDPGRFIAFPGYEWSGNTGLGGDHNVIHLREGEAIHRSSHALVYDHSDDATDCHAINDLFTTLKGKDVFFYAHAGGRYADLTRAQAPPTNLAIEIHSAWGTFEWLLHDAFDLGLRVGVVANSDDHKGRPGASYPGASTFGAYGGLTCFLCTDLSREAVFESLRSRHHYATTGTRMLLDVTASREAGDDAIMGDLVLTQAQKTRLRVEALCPAPIERVDILRGGDLLETVRPFPRDRRSRRIRVVWEGAERRGRSREATWNGSAEVNGNRFEVVRPINFWHPHRPLRQESPHRLSWNSITTGGFSGFDAWLTAAHDGVLTIKTPLIQRQVEISAIGYEDLVFEAGGLSRRLRLSRLPARNTHYHIHLERNVPLQSGEDNPIYVRLTQEDGHRIWSSPIYFITP